MPRHRSAVGRPPGQNGQTPGLDKQQYLTHSAPPEGLTRQDSGTRLARYTPGGIAPTRSNNKKDRAGVHGFPQGRRQPEEERKEEEEEEEEEEKEEEDGDGSPKLFGGTHQAGCGLLAGPTGKQGRRGGPPAARTAVPWNLAA
ncbi:unnamed protein product [Prorocentrum cordatum]|uniref:Uncharacterized protein n=1 Tax=Prorocentrum cordatum TaxID=2364126 RepID=A0ABN9R6S9_9DINO|nr:unnamed protein product [Polarella glacialis]